MKMLEIKDNILRHVFRLKAMWSNYEHPAHPKTPEQRHIDLRMEFLLSGPFFSSKASELNRSLIWALDKLAQDTSVLEACQFALSQVKRSIDSGITPYEYPNFTISYEHSMFQHIAARVRFLPTDEENKSFMNPATKNLFKGLGEYSKFRKTADESETPFKINSSFRVDNDKIEYLKSVEAFLNDFLQTLDGYDFDESRAYVGLCYVHEAVLNVLDPIKDELGLLSQAEVVQIHDSLTIKEP